MFLNNKLIDTEGINVNAMTRLRVSDTFPWDVLVFLQMKAEELMNVSLVLIVFEVTIGCGIGC